MLKTICSATTLSFVVATLCNSCIAQITINSVSRSVSSDATNFCINDPQSATSNAAGAFNQSVSSSAFDMPPQCQGFGTGTAWQSSDVTPAMISGAGDATAFGDFGGEGSGQSALTVDITVVAPTAYTLDATVDGKLEEFFPVSQTTPSSGTVRLFNSSTTIFDATASTITGDSFMFSGVIPPGNYTFLATASASASSTSQADASYDFVFSVPEPSGMILLACSSLCSFWPLRRKFYARIVGRK